MSTRKKLAPAPLLPPAPIGGATAERLQEIAELGARINGYLQFIGQIDKLPGSSGEAKAAAVEAFHRRMVAFEHHLARIQEEIQLG